MTLAIFAQAILEALTQPRFSGAAQTGRSLSLTVSSTTANHTGYLMADGTMTELLGARVTALHTQELFDSRWSIRLESPERSNRPYEDARAVVVRFSPEVPGRTLIPAIRSALNDFLAGAVEEFAGAGRP